MFKTRKWFLLLYTVIWVLVLISPYLRYLQDISPNGWNRMIGDWTNLSLLFLVFLLNLFVLVPKFLFNNKRSQYTIIVIVMISVVAVVNIILHPFIGPPLHPEIGNPPPEYLQNSPFNLQSILGAIFNNLIAALLIIGSSTALELEYKWRSEQKLRKDAEKEHLKTNLALLKHQVSPHFFLNTLNNIHALVEIDSSKAQEAIERLSTLMQYLLYDSAQNTIELKKEIEFIHSFISLMLLRHSDEVDVKTVIPEHIPDAQIPPMLFISLIENSFKHGVSYPLKSYIFFELQIHETSLHCIIKNSKHKNRSNQQGEYSGIGLSNIKESLRLLYDDKFQLNILDAENEFEVTLSIPL
ncbi:MAG: histidine kinase [Bacteroidia bacterium]|nr:histidine kinase [Bacteroidia bacterium]